MNKNNERKNKTKNKYSEQLSNMFQKIDEQNNKQDEKTSQKSNNSGKESDSEADDKIFIPSAKYATYARRKPGIKDDRVYRHLMNDKGHVTNEDIDAMKRWFIENWRDNQVIPFEILTLETFLMTYFGYTMEKIQALTERKRSVIEQKYSYFMWAVSDAVHTQLFYTENLKTFMNMCKRNFAKNKTYTPLIQAYIKEPIAMRMGYLVDSNLAMKLKEANSQNLMVANNKTRNHTIVSWLKRQKYVYIPNEYREKVSLDENYDAFTAMDEMTEYLVGYGSFSYTDVKSSPIGLSSHDSLNWFCALNNYLNTQPILTVAPQIKNFQYQPHLVVLTYWGTWGQQSIETYMLIDWDFYQDNKNDSGVINIRVDSDTLLINSNVINVEKEVITKFVYDITISCLRLTGAQIIGDLHHVDLQIKRSLSKMGTFMSKMESAKNRYLDSIKKGVYKVAVIAGKANGKTSLIDLVQGHLGKNVYIEDSDDYGKFISHLVLKYDVGNIEKLNEKLSEQTVVEEAAIFAQMVENKGVEHLTSFYNSVISVLIAPDLKGTDWNNLKDVKYDVEFCKMVSSLYRKYFVQIRDLYYKLDSGKTVNQKLYENGILRHMDSTGNRILLEFFHIFACNYRRKAANLTIRYEPNFETNISLFTRFKNKDIDLVDAVADMLLKMFYDQSAEYVSTVSGPAAFMCLFGLMPVLGSKNSLSFEFVTHSDVTE